MQRSVIEAELNECKAVKANQPWREDYGTVNAYDVPSGQLVLSFHKNGFQSLFQLSLYSTNESTFERPDIQKFFKILEPDGAKVQFDDFKLCQQILDVAKKEQFGEAERLLEGWMRRNKDNPYAFQTLAKVRAMQKRYEAAIIAMDAAIRFAAQDQLQVSNVRTVVFRDKTYGDRLLIERGTYCIETGRFQDALDDFAKGFPHRLLSQRK